MRKLLLGLALLVFACASLLAQPGWAQIGEEQPGEVQPNDNFADAWGIVGESVSVDGTTAGATREDGEPDHYTSNPNDADWWEGDHSVWYSWTAPASGPITIHTCTAEIDSILAVYTGDSLSTLDRVADNNNDYCGGGWGSKVTFDATEGTTYQIAVSDAGGLRENTFTLAIGPEADLEVYKDAYAADPAVVGESFYYEIYVYNYGPDTATNVVLEDTLPEGLDFAGFPPDHQCSYDGDTRAISCDLGDLPYYYETYEYGYVGFEVTPTAEGTLENTAEATSDTQDPDTTNNQDTATTEVVTPSADLEVSKSAPGSVLEDELLTYDISVNNNGPTTATNVVLEDILPNGLDFVRSSDERCSYDEATRTLSCELGNISYGGGGEFSASASDSVSFEVRPTGEGTLQNTASVSSDAPDPEASNDESTATTTVVSRPDPPDSIINDPGCQANTLSRNDDSSTGAVDLPFTPNFFGSDYGSTYVNNNGNVTFDGPLGTYTPFDLSTTNSAIIAPFFADVDTNASGSDEVTYGNATYGDREAFCVNWTGVAGGVGYFPSRDDKLNSFQLLLVDRSDTGAGNFDIIMNYDKIRWETGGASGGTDGLGGNSARVGFSNGRPVNSFELPGSAVNGAFLDSNPESGLIYNSRDSLQLGRYVFEVRNGDAPVGGTISGSVFRNSVDPNNALPGSLVQVCDSDNSCITSSTNSAGEYSASGLFDGEYSVRAFPPGGSNLQPNEIGPITLSGGATLEDQDIVLTGPTPPPPGTSIDNDTPSGQIPSVIVGQPNHLETTGCEEGTATYQVTGQYGGSISGSMNEGPAGTYTADFSIPFTGPAEISITIDCPEGTDDESTEFNIYIDPSGFVRDTNGDSIPGATVKLYRSDSEAGPFTLVPDQSAIMSPSNRDNPDETDSTGHFGWDVIAGYYYVTAEKTGCRAPDDPNDPGAPDPTFVESRIMEIPPPVFDLDLRLDCGEDTNTDETPPVSNHALSSQPNGAGWHKENVTVTLSATDNEGGSGVKSITYSVNGGQGQTVDGDSATIEVDQDGVNTITYFATDNEDNGETSLNTVTVRLDKTNPEVACGSADGDWHKEDVSISCTADDATSGLAGDESFSLSTSVPDDTEDANASTESRPISDVAGNTATAGPIGGNKVDKKAPEVTIASPENGARFLLRQNVAADYGCSDGGSGMASCAGPVDDGANIDTASVGQKTFAVNATDEAGNPATATNSYNVVYDFKGFFPPVKNHPALKVIEVDDDDSVIPVKFSLSGNQGTGVIADGYPKSQQIACDNLSVKTEGDESTIGAKGKGLNNGLKYQAGPDRYTYYWKTKPQWEGTCRQFVLKLNDGTFHQFNVKFVGDDEEDDDDD